MPSVFTPRYFELVFYRAYAGLRSESSRNYLSFAWWIIDPLISMGVYYLVFGVMFGGGMPNFVAFLLIGQVIWQWFGFSVNHCMGSIFQAGGLMSQVYLPKQVFPLVVILMDTVKFVLVFLLLLVFLWSYGLPPTQHYLALPALLLSQFLLNTAFGLFVAALVPFIPDLRFLFEAALFLAFFLSGIFYSVTSMPEHYLHLFYLNPMVNLIDSYRAVLMYHQWPNWERLAVVAGVSWLAILGMVLFIRTFDRRYPRMVES